MQQKSAKGKVYLVGVGPGDIELLTLKAVRILGEADVILLDELANHEVLKFVKPKAKIIDVGKRGGCKSTSQEFIYDEMIKHANEGLCVARVKGGDPFIFGRAGEELEKLKEAGIEFDIVNGITAGLAAAAMLGIPLTHREHAHSVTILTGHSCQAEHINWRAIANSGSTIVIYMGIKNVRAIVTNLVEAGLDLSTPAAAIQYATLPQQKNVLATLTDLPRLIEQNEIGSPAIVIIGKVVALSNLFKSTQFRELINSC